MSDARREDSVDDLPTGAVEDRAYDPDDREALVENPDDRYVPDGPRLPVAEDPDDLEGDLADDDDA